MTGLPDHSLYGLIHAVKVSLGTLGPCLGPLQLNRGHKLHGLGYLLGTLYTGLTPFYISH